MADVVAFPARTLPPPPHHDMREAEGVLMRAIQIVQHAAPTDSGVTRDQLLDELLELLDGPEAMAVYRQMALPRG